MYDMLCWTHIQLTSDLFLIPGCQLLRGSGLNLYLVFLRKTANPQNYNELQNYSFSSENY